MSKMDVKLYTPPGPVGEALLRDDANVVRFIMGPIGSGKTNLLFFDALSRATRMPVCSDGRRRYRHLFLRDTYANLWKSGIPTWWEWFPKTVGDWQGSDGRQANHKLTFTQPDGAHLDFEMWFLALQDDRVEDLLRGIEFTGATMNECDRMSGDVLPYLLGRVMQRRFPPVRSLPPEAIVLNDEGKPEPNYRTSVTGDMNPPDEDNWTFEVFEEKLPDGHKLYIQPSGRSPQGENHVAISRATYEDIAAKNAYRKWWVDRMVDGKWGYSRDGEPVYPEYDDQRHCSGDELRASPELPLWLAFDQGVRGPAMVVGQKSSLGQLRIVDELVPGSRIGPTHFAKQCGELLADRYRGFVIAGAVCDPAGFAGGDAEYGDRAWAEIVADVLRLAIEPAPTNELNARLDGVRQLLTYYPDGRPALLVSRRCKVLRKGFMSHYRYKVRGEGNTKTVDPKPEKNTWSNPHDAVQYLVLMIFGLDGVIAGRPGGERRIGHFMADDDDGDRHRGSVAPNHDFDVYGV